MLKLSIWIRILQLFMSLTPNTIPMCFTQANGFLIHSNEITKISTDIFKIHVILSVIISLETRAVGPPGLAIEFMVF